MRWATVSLHTALLTLAPLHAVPSPVLSVVAEYATSPPLFARRYENFDLFSSLPAGPSDTVVALRNPYDPVLPCMVVSEAGDVRGLWGPTCRGRSRYEGSWWGLLFNRAVTAQSGDDVVVVEEPLDPYERSLVHVFRRDAILTQRWYLPSGARASLGLTLSPDGTRLCVAGNNGLVVLDRAGHVLQQWSAPVGWAGYRRFQPESVVWTSEDCLLIALHKTVILLRTDGTLVRTWNLGVTQLAAHGSLALAFDERRRQWHSFHLDADECNSVRASVQCVSSLRLVSAHCMVASFSDVRMGLLTSSGWE